MTVSIDKIDKLDDFLSSGAFLQLDSDLFRLFWGPFEELNQETALNMINLKSEQNYPGFVFLSDFWSFLDSKSNKFKFYRPQRTIDLTRIEFQHYCKSLNINKKMNRTIQNDENFKNQYDWIQEKITQKKITKALPITSLETSLDEDPSVPMMIQSVLKVTEGYSYGFWNNSEGFIGLTPELLGDYFPRLNELKTMALAGTWLKKNEQFNDFNDPKIKNEHQVVVDDIKIQLNDFELLSQGATQVIELPHLFHLKTEFKYSCQSIDQYVQIISKLHPTAALGVFPRDIDLMKEFSEFPIQRVRKNFGAPFGILSSDYCRSIVAIRNVFWTNKGLQIFAGCGVTKQSDYSSEWDEVLSKQDSVLKILGFLK